MVISPPATISFRTIGIVRSGYRSRILCPRQPGVEPKAESAIHLFGSVCDGNPHVVRGLNGFDRIWVLSHLHLNNDSAPVTVRPPGRKKKVGIFASRAPHRPCGPLGLSCVRLLGVEAREKAQQVGGGVILRIAGADLLDGTPVLDIKPYIPAYDSFPNSKVADWLQEAPEPVQLGRKQPELPDGWVCL